MYHQPDNDEELTVRNGCLSSCDAPRISLQWKECGMVPSGSPRNGRNYSRYLKASCHVVWTGPSAPTLASTTGCRIGRNDGSRAHDWRSDHAGKRGLSAHTPGALLVSLPAYLTAPEENNEKARWPPPHRNGRLTIATHVPLLLRVLYQGT